MKEESFERDLCFLNRRKKSEVDNRYSVYSLSSPFGTGDFFL